MEVGMRSMFPKRLQIERLNIRCGHQPSLCAMERPPRFT
jgi:hypothetical protein